MLLSHVQLYSRIIVSNSHGNTSNYVDTATIFQKLEQNGQRPQHDLWPTSVEVTCDSTQGSFYPSPYQSMWIQWLFFKNLMKWSMTPRWPLTNLCCGHMCDSTQGSFYPSPYQKYVDTVTIFQKLNEMINDHKMTSDQLQLRSHVWLYPRIILSKSLWKYVDTVTSFQKT